MSKQTSLIIGGGAAGFFGAIHAKETHPDWDVILVEKSPHLLSKVKVSGGGRCNVTHACFDPKALAAHYPRGAKALIGAFHQFQPKDTIAWFAKRGVKLKTEADGRMFPVTDSSQTIIDCLFKSARMLGVHIRTQVAVNTVLKTSGGFDVHLSDGTTLKVNKILLATGGNAQNKGWEIAKSLGHTIEPPVPSLFTFKINDPSLHALQGLSLPMVEASVPSLKLKTQGPLLITHWGLSGPAILKLSAWGARLLNEVGYKFELKINAFPDISLANWNDLFHKIKLERARQFIWKHPFLNMPYRLWEKWVGDTGIPADQKYADLSKDQWSRLVSILSDASFQVTGKSTHKDEFVTCGGVRLSEVDFKTLQSKRVPGLYFAGEVLDIDGITGGFNFQAAWTTSWIATQR